MKLKIAYAFFLSAFSVHAFGMKDVNFLHVRTVDDFFSNNPLKTTFGTGLVARGVATAIGGALSPVILQEIDRIVLGQEPNNSTAVSPAVAEEQTFIRSLFSILTGVDISIALWLSVQMIQKRLAGFKGARATLSDSAYQSGMDTYVFCEALVSSYGAVSAIYRAFPATSVAMPELLINEYVDKQFVENNTNNATCLAEFQNQSPSHMRALATSVLTAAIVAWASFYAGGKLASKITKNSFLSTMIIFNVGIGLLSLIREGFFKVGDYFDFTTKCNACQDVYTAGSDLSYVFTGVLPGYFAFYKMIKGYGKKIA